MQTCAASAASRPSGIATTAVRGVIRSLTGRWANASTPETTAISPAEARAPVSAPESTAARVVRRDPSRRTTLAAVLSGADTGALASAGEMAVVSGVLAFAQRPVKDLMTPRTAVVAIPEGRLAAEAAHVCMQSRYSRYPVYRGSLDEIAGVAHAFDLLQLAPDGPVPVRPALVVPGATRAADLMLEMQRGRSHLAVVRDEFGGTAGLATFEDLLRDLLSDILEPAPAEPSLHALVRGVGPAGGSRGSRRHGARPGAGGATGRDGVEGARRAGGTTAPSRRAAARGRARLRRRASGRAPQRRRGRDHPRPALRRARSGPVGGRRPGRGRSGPQVSGRFGRRADEHRGRHRGRGGVARRGDRGHPAPVHGRRRAVPGVRRRWGAPPQGRRLGRALDRRVPVTPRAPGDGAARRGSAPRDRPGAGRAAHGPLQRRRRAGGGRAQSPARPG